MTKQLIKLGLRKCYICKCILPLNNDNFAKSKKITGFVYECLPCSRKKIKKWIKNDRILNPEKYKKQRREWYLKYGKFRKIKKDKDYYKIRYNILKEKLLTNPTFRENFLAKNRKYADKYRYSRNKTRLKLRFKLLEKYNFTCQYCGRKSPNVKLEIDHIIPKSKGGTNNETNLIVACHDCNMGKLDKILTEFKLY